MESETKRAWRAERYEITGVGIKVTCGSAVQQLRAAANHGQG